MVLKSLFIPNSGGRMFMDVAEFITVIFWSKECSRVDSERE